MIIKNGAIFIADAHYNKTRGDLFEFLNAIYKKEIGCSQLFLMGDIFDFLCDEVDYFQEINYPLIELIEKISSQIETIYFEGNHDFSLEDTFSNVNIVSRKKQPIYTNIGEKKVALAHGDIFTPKSYEIYTKIIRNPFVLNFLNIVDINNWLSKIVEKRLAKKQLCNKQIGFEKFVEKRVAFYGVDLIIEGHFHQNYSNQHYINLPSFACNSGYIQYLNDEFKFFKV